MAVGKVEQIITIRGDDQASAVVGEVKKNLDGVGKSALDIADKAGGLEKGFRGVKDLVGGIAPQLAPVIDSLGGVGDLIEGFAGKLGPVGLAFGAITIAATALYAAQKKAQQEAIDARVKEIERIKESDRLLAERYLAEGARGRELLQIQEGFKTADEARTAAREQLKIIADAEIAVEKAKAEDLEKQNEAAKKLVDAKDRERTIMTELKDLQDAETRAADRKLRAETFSIEQQIERAEREAFIASIIVKEDKFHQEIKLLQEDQNALAAKEAELRAKINSPTNGLAKTLELGKELLVVVKQRLGLEAEINTKSAEFFRARQQERNAAAAQRKRDADEEAKRQKQLLADRREREIKQGEEEVKANEALRRATIESLDIEEQAQARKTEVLYQAELERERIRQSIELNETARNARLQALELTTQKSIADITEKETARVKAIADKAAADDIKRKEDQIKATEALAAAQRKERTETQKQISELTALIGPAAAVAQAMGGPGGVAAAISTAAAETEKLTAAWVENGTVGAASVIGGVGAVAAATVDGEKEKAAILALTSAAQAAIFFATGQIPQGIAATAAAALYGAAAGGLIGGGASVPSGGGGFAAAGGGGGAGGGGAAVDMGGATTVINFTAPLGTPYEIGKSVAKAQKASAAGGWNPRMAMGV